MVYVKRDADNNIIAVYAEPMEDAVEDVDNDSGEVQGFLSKCNLDKQDELLKSDLELIRVVEDLVQILIAKNLISITDFPIAAIEKLSQRGKIRSQYQKVSDIVDKL